MSIRTFRRLSLLIAIIILFYILFNYEPLTSLPNLAFAPTSTIEVKYNRLPVYEYESLYRQSANLTLENELEDKLLNLQKAALRRGRGKEGEGERGLIAKKIIWQITIPSLAESWSAWTKQWKDNNKEWEYKLYTSPPTDILPLFESLSEIGDVNERFPGIREDLMRYLILWYHGGFWTAVDTWDRVALRDCGAIAQVLNGERDVGLMVGVDNDEPFLSWETLRRWGWTRGFGFGQGVIWAPRRFDEVLRKAIVRTISHAFVDEELKERGSWSERQFGRLGGKMDYSSELSGAGMFTDIVLEVLSQSLVEEHKLRDRDAGLEKRVTWKKITKLKDVLWLEKDQIKENLDEEMSGLAILPLNIWGNGQSHSKSGPADAEDACVNHVHGWRPQKHNIFG